MTNGSIALQCKCGSVSGNVSPVGGGIGNRAICYCKDCQAFAYFLGREDDVLNKLGGTDIFQTVPAYIHIKRGHEQLRSMKLSSSGMVRWYTACCKTPVANTMSAQLPFAGIPLPILNLNVDPKTVDRLIGPPVGHFHTGSARNPKAEFESQSFSTLRMTFNVLKFLIIGKIRKLNRPSPFYDKSHAPVSEPAVISPEVRESIYARVGAPKS